MIHPTHRGSLFLEEAEILDHQSCPGAQYLLRLRAPECAAAAHPGSFVHLRCDPLLPMRRPISIMRANPGEGWIELLYKVVGQGTQLLSQRRIGESLSLIGPIGTPFQVHPERPRPLLIGGGVGMPPLMFLAESLRRQTAYRPLALFGSEVPFPFRPRPSQILVSALPAGVIACLPLLDDWDIPSRLASLQGFPGCFQGHVTDLARTWLSDLEAEIRQEIEIFACGPHPMLVAVARLAHEFSLPCQLSLEEYMACGLGGCAGCVVTINTPGGPAMKRVCVDGPVFDGQQVIF